MSCACTDEFLSIGQANLHEQEERQLGMRMQEGIARARSAKQSTELTIKEEYMRRACTDAYSSLNKCYSEDTA